MKINIIGTSGSGKSTFSKQIAQKLNIPHIELDALFWKENWTPSSDQEFFTKIEKAIKLKKALILIILKLIRVMKGTCMI